MKIELMKSLLIFYLISALYPLNNLTAQEHLLNPFNGISARAAGMGQAYTALVDDPTSIYWNPAAMSVIKNGYTGFMLRHGTKSYSVDTDDIPNINTWDISANPVTDLGFLGIVFPFHGGIANTTLGVGVRRYVAFPQEQTEEITTTTEESYKLNYNHEGDVSVFTVAVSLSLIKELSLGGTLNFYTGEEKSSIISSNPDFDEELIYSITQEYSRTSFEFGARYQYDSNWIFGLKINFPFTLEIKKNIGLTDPIIMDELLSFPLHFNLAGAYLLNQNIKVTADYFYRPWQRVSIETPTYNYQLTDYSLHSLHIGGEYLTSISEVPLALRLGYYTVPTIYTTRSNDQRINHAVTAGIGYPGQWIILNLGLEWIPSDYETGSVETLVPGLSSEIPNVPIKSHTFQISFDLFIQIT